MPKVVTFGEVMLRLSTPMLRLSTPGYLRFSQAHQFDATFGGGEANVAVSLANYGIDTQFVTRLPKNDIADMCVAELRGLGVGTDGIVWGGDRVGIYYLETGAVARGSKVVYDRAHSAISEIQPGMVDWHKVLEGADWFHWTGITPALSQGAADACLEAIKVANEMGVKVSCDLNYRKKLWKYGKSASEVMPALVEGCDLILGNEEDAEKEFGIKPEGFDAEKTGGEIDQTAFISVCRQLMDKFPRCKKVAVTLRGSINANHNTWGGVLYDGKTGGGLLPQAHHHRRLQPRHRRRSRRSHRRRRFRPCQQINLTMAKFKKFDTVGIIKGTGIVPVFYNADVELTKKVVKACYDGGIRAFEFTNRGDGAHRVFKEVISFVRAECPEMAFGAGTILDAPTAALYLQLGADFLVSPCLVDEVAPLCNRRGVPYSPGCGTVTEIVHAMELGCDLVKVFPAGTVGGPAFVKNVLGPLPWAMIMCTGAVEPTEENLTSWAKSGVTAVGMGSKLFPKEVLKAGDWASVSALCAKCLDWFRA